MSSRPRPGASNRWPARGETPATSHADDLLSVDWTPKLRRKCGRLFGSRALAEGAPASGSARGQSELSGQEREEEEEGEEPNQAASPQVGGPLDKRARTMLQPEQQVPVRSIKLCRARGSSSQLAGWLDELAKMPAGEPEPALDRCPRVARADTSGDNLSAMSASSSLLSQLLNSSLNQLIEIDNGSGCGGDDCDQHRRPLDERDLLLVGRLPLAGQPAGRPTDLDHGHGHGHGHDHDQDQDQDQDQDGQLSSCSTLTAAASDFERLRRQILRRRRGLRTRAGAGNRLWRKPSPSLSQEEDGVGGGGAWRDKSDERLPGHKAAGRQQFVTFDRSTCSHLFEGSPAECCAELGPEQLINGNNQAPQHDSLLEVSRSSRRLGASGAGGEPDGARPAAFHRRPANSSQAAADLNPNGVIDRHLAHSPGVSGGLICGRPECATCCCCCCLCGCCRRLAGELGLSWPPPAPTSGLSLAASDTLPAPVGHQPANSLAGSSGDESGRSSCAVRVTTTSDSSEDCSGPPLKPPALGSLARRRVEGPEQRRIMGQVGAVGRRQRQQQCEGSEHQPSDATSVWGAKFEWPSGERERRWPAELAAEDELIAKQIPLQQTLVLPVRRLSLSRAGGQREAVEQAMFSLDPAVELAERSSMVEVTASLARVVASRPSSGASSGPQSRPRLESARPGEPIYDVPSLSLLEAQLRPTGGRCLSPDQKYPQLGARPVASPVVGWPIERSPDVVGGRERAPSGKDAKPAAEESVRRATSGRRRRLSVLSRLALDGSEPSRGPAEQRQRSGTSTRTSATTTSTTSTTSASEAGSATATSGCHSPSASSATSCATAPSSGCSACWRRSRSDSIVCIGRRLHLRRRAPGRDWLGGAEGAAQCGRCRRRAGRRRRRWPADEQLAARSSSSDRSPGSLTAAYLRRHRSRRATSGRRHGHRCGTTGAGRSHGRHACGRRSKGFSKAATSGQRRAQSSRSGRWRPAPDASQGPLDSLGRRQQVVLKRLISSEHASGRGEILGPGRPVEAAQQVRNVTASSKLAAWRRNNDLACERPVESPPANCQVERSVHPETAAKLNLNSRKARQVAWSGQRDGEADELGEVNLGTRRQQVAGGRRAQPRADLSCSHCRRHRRRLAGRRGLRARRRRRRRRCHCPRCSPSSPRRHWLEGSEPAGSRARQDGDDHQLLASQRKRLIRLLGRREQRHQRLEPGRLEAGSGLSPEGADPTGWRRNVGQPGDTTAGELATGGRAPRRPSIGERSGRRTKAGFPAATLGRRSLMSSATNTCCSGGSLTTSLSRAAYLSGRGRHRPCGCRCRRHHGRRLRAAERRNGHQSRHYRRGARLAGHLSGSSPAASQLGRMREALISSSAAWRDNDRKRSTWRPASGPDPRQGGEQQQVARIRRRSESQSAGRKSRPGARPTRAWTTGDEFMNRFLVKTLARRAQAGARNPFRCQLATHCQCSHCLLVEALVRMDTEGKSKRKLPSQSRPKP